MVPARKRNGLRLCAFTAACSYEDSSVIISVRVAHRHFDSSRSLMDQLREAVENRHITFSGGTKLCRISSNAIYRALGVENIRHRRSGPARRLSCGRLLSLDFVLEHSNMIWLPAEPEKVEFFEEIGLPLRLIPRRIFCGVVGATASATLRSNCPLPWNLTIVTFVYADPGHQTHTELHAWGAAHGPLWDALRKKGRQVLRGRNCR